MCGDSQTPPGRPHRVQSCTWGPCSGGRVVYCKVDLHPHYSAPTRSRLGVFICGFRTPRGLPGRSACAASRLAKGDTVPGSPLFRPIFSRNLRQLLRRGTRRQCCPSSTCACAAGNGLPACLHERSRCATCEASPRSSFGRERIVAVAVALTDLPVSSLDEQLTLLVDGNPARAVNRLSLG